MVTSAALGISPYQPRRTQSLGVQVRAGWSLKLIGISADGVMPSESELAAVLTAAEAYLPQPMRPTASTRTGFVIVHRGTEALWVLVCWWELDLLYRRLLRAVLGTTDLQPVPPDGPTACVWELLAIDHERHAWVTHVLRRPADPDIPGYLSAVPAMGVGDLPAPRADRHQRTPRAVPGRRPGVMSCRSLCGSCGASARPRPVLSTVADRAPVT